jgi:hypothetical protein
MAPILLRYAEADAPYGEHLLSTLTEAGLAVSAAPAPATRQRCAAQAEASQAVVVLWSRQALRSPALLLQAAMAKAQGKLVAARIEPGVSPPGEVSMIDLTDWRRGFPALTAMLSGAQGAMPPSTRAPNLPTMAAATTGGWSEPKVQSAKPAKALGWVWMAGLSLMAICVAGLALLGKLG